MTTERDYWEQQVREAAHTELDHVQKVAGNWKTLTGALTGLFATAAFAGGTAALEDLADPWPDLLRWVTVLALVTGITATVLFARIDGLKIDVSNDQTWQRRRDETRRAADTAFDRLGPARTATIAFAGLVVLGSVATLLLPRAASSAPKVVVVSDTGTRCGVLGQDASGVTVGGRPAGVVRSVTVVTRCS